MKNKYREQAITTTESKVVVNSCAAATKTSTIVERVQWLIENGVEPSKIVMLTFTNNAAMEMKDRIGEKAEGVFIGTIHSYAAFLLSAIGFPVSKYTSTEKFDELIREAMRHPECRMDVQHLVVDESQDSDDLLWEFVLDFMKPQNYFLVGDGNQQIFSFAGSSDKFVELANSPDTITYSLPFNYRNDIAILNYAKKFIEKNFTSLDTSIPVSTKAGEVLEMEYDESAILKYLDWYKQKGYDYGNWFILCRTNAQINELHTYLTAHDIPHDTFRQAELTTDQLQKKMKDNTIKLLTIHSAKGLEADCVMVVGGQKYNDEERRVCYVAATRARHVLIWFKPKRKRRKSPTTNITSWE